MAIQIPEVLQTIITLMLSVIVEALPFIVIGVLVSTSIRLFIKPEFLFKILPKNSFFRKSVLASTGMLAPVCECGNVPVARSLISRGVAPSDSVAFLLGAPILNPITIASTATAFSFAPSVVWLRIAFGFVIAVSVSYIVGMRKDHDILTKKFAVACTKNHQEEKTLTNFTKTYVKEFTLLLFALSLGAIIVALTQVMIPRYIIEFFSNSPFISVLVMILFGFVISICSSVDAFFALAYVNIFPTASLLAFLVAGPMVDIKMAGLMRTTFTTKTIAIIILSVAILTAVCCIGALYVLA